MSQEVVLSLEGVAKEFLPPSPMRVRRFFARLGGLQIDEHSADRYSVQVEDDDDDFGLDDGGDILEEEEPRSELTSAGLRVLSDVTFEARAGSLIALSGRSGAGKTTLLKVASGMTPPTAGRVVVRGTVAPALNEMATVLPSRGHNVRSALPQLGAMVGIPARVVRDALDAVDDLMQVPGILRAYTSSMEASRKRELVLALALSVEPDILLSDFSFRPDSDFALRCLERAAHLRERGSLVMLEASNVGKAPFAPDEVVTIENGRVV